MYTRSLVHLNALQKRIGLGTQGQVVGQFWVTYPTLQLRALSTIPTCKGTRECFESANVCEFTKQKLKSSEMEWPNNEFRRGTKGKPKHGYNS